MLHQMLQLLLLLTLLILSVNPGVIVNVVATEMLEKPLEKVVQETEVQGENVVEETDVTDDVPDIGSSVKRKGCGKKFHMNVLPNGEVLIRTMWHPLSNCTEGGSDQEEEEKDDEDSATECD